MAESCSSIVLSLETQDRDEPDSFLRNRICVCDNEEEREEWDLEVGKGWRIDGRWRKNGFEGI